MVLSIAFVLAFVASAIVLLIGIIIFSDITEAMALTLPVVSGGTGGSETLIACTKPLNPNLAHFFEVEKDSTLIQAVNTMTAVASPNLEGCNGMSVDPTDGKVYIFIEDGGFVNTRLMTLDTTTHVLTNVGLTGDKYTGLQFKGDGSLFAVGGNAHSTDPSGLFSIDKSNGTPTLECTIPRPASNKGQALGFNTDDGKLYHVSGTRGIDQIIQSIDNESTCATTSVATTGFQIPPFFAPDELTDLAYSPEDSIFYTSYGDSRVGFGTITTGGVTTNINLTAFDIPPIQDEQAKGMAIFGAGSAGTPLTASQQNEIDTFENARNIGFTVIGILPIVLFFALFSIFSGREL